MKEAERSALRQLCRDVSAVNADGTPQTGYLRFEVPARSGGRSSWKVAAAGVDFADEGTTLEQAEQRVLMLFEDGAKVVRIGALRTGQSHPFRQVRVNRPDGDDDDEDDDDGGAPKNATEALARLAWKVGLANERLMDRNDVLVAQHMGLTATSARLLGKIEGSAGHEDGEGMARAVEAALPIVDRYGDMFAAWLFRTVGGDGTPPPPPRPPPAASAPGSSPPPPPPADDGSPVTDDPELAAALEVVVRGVRDVLRILSTNPALATPRVRQRIQDIMNGKV